MDAERMSDAADRAAGAIQEAGAAKHTNGTGNYLFLYRNEIANIIRDVFAREPQPKLDQTDSPFIISDPLIRKPIDVGVGEQPVAQESDPFNANEVYTKPYDAGYAAGRASVAAELAQLRAELEEARDTIERFKVDVRLKDELYENKSKLLSGAFQAMDEDKATIAQLRAQLAASEPSARAMRALEIMAPKYDPTIFQKLEAVGGEFVIKIHGSDKIETWHNFRAKTLSAAIIAAADALVPGWEERE